MKITNQSFPHPVLGIRDDVLDSFETEFNWDCDQAYFYLKPIFKLTNSTLLKMIKENKAVYAVEVECSNTLFRKTFYTDKIGPEIPIQAEYLRGKVLVQFLVVSKVELSDYKIENANAEYEDNKFIISIGDVLAYGGDSDFQAVVNYDSLKAVSSIMQIKKGNYDTGYVKTNFFKDKIQIILSREDYQKYKLLISDPANIPIFHTSLVLPVLYKALVYVHEEDDDFAQFKWFDVIKTRLDDEDLNLDDDEKHIEVLQKIFGNPYRRLFDSLLSKYEDFEDND